MSLFDLVRSVLGLDESSDRDRTEVSVDHGTSEAKAVEEAAATDTDATASTDSMTQTPSSDPETAAEPAEAESTADEAVDTIDGIGPAYGERLAAAGVETVADLLAADAEELADEIDISETRVSRWQDQAAA